MDETVLRGKNILVVDDEVDLREIVASELEFMGANVSQAGNVVAADFILKQTNIDLIISDIRMPGGTGIDLLKMVKARSILNPPVILITGFADITAEEAYAEGAEALLNKPFQLDELIQVCARLIQPLENRFSEEATETENKISMVSNFPLKGTPHFELGRGGVFLQTDNSRKYEIGVKVSLELKFSDVEISAIAIPRWTKLSVGNGKLCLGLELLNLDVKSFEYLQSYWQTSPGLAFIPKSS
jgi:CheY-like chemotaxis protein